jgi:hypothetical protein
MLFLLLNSMKIQTNVYIRRYAYSLFKQAVTYTYLPLKKYFPINGKYKEMALKNYAYILLSGAPDTTYRLITTCPAQLQRTYMSPLHIHTYTLTCFRTILPKMSHMAPSILPWHCSWLCRIILWNSTFIFSPNHSLPLHSGRILLRRDQRCAEPRGDYRPGLYWDLVGSLPEAKYRYLIGSSLKIHTVLLGFSEILFTWPWMYGGGDVFPIL